MRIPDSEGKKKEERGEGKWNKALHRLTSPITTLRALQISVKQFNYSYFSWVFGLQSFRVGTWGRPTYSIDLAVEPATALKISRVRFHFLRRLHWSCISNKHADLVEG